MANKNQEYTEQYADYAMAQMRRYGIPASVTLAQGILESSNGQSRLAVNENNHFGIKATPEWIAEGGRYGLYSDDKPNEKFCSYDSVGDSYEHHSRFLKENSRYARCFSLSPDDYKGWTQGLEKAGYATGGHYADSLQRIIEQNGLQKYDRQVMQEMETQA
jgi:flagellum-specific peptidoglycan hydrolase FlgJ